MALIRINILKKSSSKVFYPPKTRVLFEIVSLCDASHVLLDKLRIIKIEIE